MQTRFYNLQAEATLSSLDSNLDPNMPQDTSCSNIAATSPKFQSKRSVDSRNVASKLKDVGGIPVDGEEGDDEDDEKKTRNT